MPSLNEIRFMTGLLWEGHQNHLEVITHTLVGPTSAFSRSVWHGPENLCFQVPGDITGIDTTL